MSVEPHGDRHHGKVDGRRPGAPSLASPKGLVTRWFLELRVGIHRYK